MPWWKRLTLLLLLTCGCGLSSCETPIERERRELKEAGESSEALIYRAIKISIRSMPSKLNPNGPDAEATKINRLTVNLLRKLERTEGAEADQPQPEALSPGEYVEVAKELYELRKVLRETDEDRYPTVLHTLLVDDAVATANMSWYHSTHEHMAFALAWLAVKQVPPGFRVYETGMIDPAAIEQPGLKIGAHLIRGATFLSQSWPLMCEEEMTGYLAVFDAEHDELLVWARAAQALAQASGEQVVALDEAQLLATVHSPGVLLRGLCRLQADKEDEALADLESFLRDAELLGLEGEAVWLIGAYVGIKRDDQELALANLRKLETSKLLGSSERELVSDAIEALEEREPGAALNAITDKLVVARVASAYVVRELGKVEWRQLFEASEGGQKIMRLTTLLADEVAAVRSSLSIDELGELGGKASGWANEIGCGAE
jgi:hypothetical protein